MPTATAFTGVPFFTVWLRSMPSITPPPRFARAIAARFLSGIRARILSVAVLSINRAQASRQAADLFFDPRNHGANRTCMMAVTGLGISNVTAPQSLPESHIPIIRPLLQATLYTSPNCSKVFGLKSSPMVSIRGSYHDQIVGRDHRGKGSMRERVIVYFSYSPFSGVGALGLGGLRLRERQLWLYWLHGIHARSVRRHRTRTETRTSDRQVLRHPGK